jgi:hypothetical protein
MARSFAVNAAVPRLILGLALLSLSTEANAADIIPQMPMPIVEEQSANFRWLKKPVIETRLLDDVEQTNRWSHHGPGKIMFTRERSKDGLQSVRIVSPTRTDKPGPVVGRPFGECVARCNFAGEDWSAFNRLSFWVYPHLPGFKVISMLVKLHNQGAEKVPDDYGREGLNYFLLEPDQWNHVVWEIPHLSRDKVTAVDFIYRLQGNEAEATEIVQFDVDRLELQRVEADYFEGWNVVPDRIAYSHSGYPAGANKTAIATRLAAKEFKLIETKSKKTVLTKEIKSVKVNVGEFQLLDFSEVLRPGVYSLEAGDLRTQPFSIGDDAWRDSIVKSINLFYCERCGARIPGIHDACHRDWRAVHGDKDIFINGGWHDAGDLSQALVNTAEATYAMFDLAERLREDDKALSARLIEEAKWGLRWIHKTRFGGGYRTTWATMDFWTDGKLGTVDDVRGDVENSPFDNFQAAATEAIAARILKERDSRLAERSLQLAREDWRFATNKIQNPGVELASAGALASVELFKATREMVYASKAFELAEVILESQQREWTGWQIPLTGFFYTGPKRERILHYNHVGHEQAPIVALVELCEAFREHADWMKWYSAVVLHSGYLKTIAKLTEPYTMLPASVYRVDESDEPGFREQVMNGVKLDENHYLRLFPVWFDFRGNSGTTLSQARALAAAARLRGDPEAVKLVERQLEWHLGRNPFCQSLMFGEGHDYAPQYTAMSGDMAGSLPVGIQTRKNLDVPYWPAANCYNYKEVWVHPSSRWLGIMRDVAGSATVSGFADTRGILPVEFEEVKTHQRFQVKPQRKSGQFTVRLPEGQYLVRHEAKQKTVTLLPGQRYQLDLRHQFDFGVAAEKAADGTIVIKVKAEQEGAHRFALRAHNLSVKEKEQTLEVKFGQSGTLTWHATRISANEPWVAVVVPDGNLAEREEITDMR